MMMAKDKQHTGSQHLVILYRFLSQGFTVRPSEYAAEYGINRTSLYHQLKLLKRMGFPVINIDYGEWRMGQDEDSDLGFFGLFMGDDHLTTAQRLVVLYRDMERGQLISPTAYARKAGVRRNTIYRQLDLLSQAGLPVVNTKLGWKLL